MDKKLKNAYDPKLAHSYKAGSTVSYMQPAKDNKWGRYYFMQYNRYYNLFMKAEKHYKETLALLSKCRKLPVNEKTKDRTLPDDLRDNLEIASMKFVIINKLAFEYMTIELLAVVNNIHVLKGSKAIISWETFELMERIKLLLHNLSIKIEIPSKVAVLLTRRDYVEHPSQSRLYDVRESQWKNVQLAWVLTGKIEGAYKQTITFVNTIFEKFEAFDKNNQIPGMLTGIKRGLKSDDPYKKTL